MATQSQADTYSEPRVKLAIVIGISNYDHEKQLENAENDATDMSTILKKIGFVVSKPKPEDLTCKRMEHVLNDFKYSIKPGDIVVLYFAGHGLQWEVCIQVLQSLI
ncbi:unnamed protein product [Rotaria sp. Silwood1]|nr:unnamed protein product [Rotaria sp. Silwood1]CAF1678001.1 unnamed protein product [Rotaria sp. Silwood1]CAF3937960.1 unnamed protein product [Rotaria sp. Silwood1]CAF4073065.1 unnamed protein product [Rotaria sp. Silwood1]CAF5056175.1 unnamed protein product [Rotaria sp. Silwood1]